MNTNTNTARFTIDFLNKQIIGTKASFNKAGKGFGAEYEELAAKTANHPNFELIVKAQKHQTTKAKRTYGRLDFKFMEAYISIQDNAEAVNKEYSAVKKMAENTTMSVYPFTKKWFLGKFGTKENPFDMSKAREAISDYRIAKAQANVVKPIAVADQMPDVA